MLKKKEKKLYFQLCYKCFIKFFTEWRAASIGDDGDECDDGWCWCDNDTDDDDDDVDDEPMCDVCGETLFDEVVDVVDVVTELTAPAEVATKEKVRNLEGFRKRISASERVFIAWLKRQSARAVRGCAMTVFA